MRLVENWRHIAGRAASMWSFYLSVLGLVAPDLIYWVWGIDTNPRLWWFGALALLIYGIVGRLVDQGIDRNRARSPWAVAAVALLITLAVVTGDWRHPEAPIVPAAPQAARSTSLPVSDEAFVDFAVPFVARWEGLRLTAYRDIVGVWTICFGQTHRVRPRETRTEAQCNAELARDVLRYRAGLHRHVSPSARTRHLTVERDTAFTSLAYNVGIAGAGKSTAVKRLNTGDLAGACEALTWWNKAGGRVIRGLVRRRSDERALCLLGIST